MRYLIFTNTPAHVHLYKHAVRELRDRGHDVLVLGRDYDCTRELLEYYDLPHRIYGRCNTTKTSLFSQLPKHFFNAFRLARRYDPDLVFGMGSYAALTGTITGASTVLILDSENHAVDHAVSRPLVRAMLTPHAFRKDLGEKHYRFQGFKECAYLHPDVYEPRPEIRGELGLGPDEKFALVRLNAFGSHHDVGESGFTPAQRRDLIDRLSEEATVLVSDEGGNTPFEDLDARPFDLHPAKIHDALAEAHLLVSDTGTMNTEAALLGTPAVRSTSFIGEDDMGNFVELEDNGLLYNIEDFDRVIETASELVRDDDVKRRWAESRTAYMADKVNLTDLIVDVATSGDVVQDRSIIARQKGVQPTP